MKKYPSKKKGSIYGRLKPRSIGKSRREERLRKGSWEGWIARSYLDPLFDPSAVELAAVGKGGGLAAKAAAAAGFVVTACPIGPSPTKKTFSRKKRKQGLPTPTEHEARWIGRRKAFCCRC